MYNRMLMIAMGSITAIAAVVGVIVLLAGGAIAGDGDKRTGDSNGNSGLIAQRLGF